MKNLQLVFGHRTPIKAFITALFVGTILTAINHGDQIIEGKFPHFAKIAMTYIVPYIVTTWGSILGKKSKLNKEN
tara:strand:+ start:589 stop:813 length:225 start_codon:yes stop_codon:yes gene_type:complete